MERTGYEFMLILDVLNEDSDELDNFNLSSDYVDISVSLEKAAAKK